MTTQETVQESRNILRRFGSESTCLRPFCIGIRDCHDIGISIPAGFEWSNQVHANSIPCLLTDRNRMKRPIMTFYAFLTLLTFLTMPDKSSGRDMERRVKVYTYYLLLPAAALHCRYVAVRYSQGQYHKQQFCFYCKVTAAEACTRVPHPTVLMNRNHPTVLHKYHGMASTVAYA